ncbi:MAG: hypothetical protein ACKVOL_08050 [Novosphingobium sp.]
MRRFAATASHHVSWLIDALVSRLAAMAGAYMSEAVDAPGGWKLWNFLMGRKENEPAVKVWPAPAANWIKERGWFSASALEAIEKNAIPAFNMRRLGHDVSVRLLCDAAEGDPGRLDLDKTSRLSIN